MDSSGFSWLPTFVGELRGDVNHLQRQVADIKSELAALRLQIDEKVERVNHRFDEKRG
jgi:hypothetical protein